MNVVDRPHSAGIRIPQPLQVRRMLIADDHSVVRRGLRQVMSEEFDALVVTEAETGTAAVDAVNQEDFDVVLLDLSFPDQSGLDVLRSIKMLSPHLPVIILSMYPEEQFALRAYKAGAAAYLTKGAASEELVLAVRTVIERGQYLSPHLEAYFDGVSPHDVDGLLHELLSNRELEVLCLLGQGRSVGEIADALHVSIKTVSSHRTHILDKLRLQTTAELIHYAIDHKLFA